MTIYQFDVGNVYQEASRRAQVKSCSQGIRQGGRDGCATISPDGRMCYSASWLRIDARSYGDYYREKQHTDEKQSCCKFHDEPPPECAYGGRWSVAAQKRRNVLNTEQG